ncbi:MAG: hypothetical protein ACI8P3_000020 [Saprospiraceae bacterium]|jgi:hypothetical protein
MKRESSILMDSLPIKFETMQKKIFLYAGVLFLGLTVFAFTNKEHHDSDTEKAVKELILKSYVNGAFNGLDPEAMQKGFHPDFAIFSAKGENIGKYPIASWVAGTKKSKNDPKFDPAKNIWTHNFVSVDVTGGSAAVKIELSHDGKHVYTDYLSLLEFDSGWRIVAKVYHEHK